MESSNRIVFFLGAFLSAVLPLVSLCQTRVAFPSNTRCEGNYYYTNDSLYTDAIVVKFLGNTIDLPLGTRFATRENIAPQFGSLRNAIAGLEMSIVRRATTLRLGMRQMKQVAST